MQIESANNRSRIPQTLVFHRSSRPLTSSLLYSLATKKKYLPDGIKKYCEKQKISESRIRASLFDRGLKIIGDISSQKTEKNISPKLLKNKLKLADSYFCVALSGEKSYFDLKKLNINNPKIKKLPFFDLPRIILEITNKSEFQNQKDQIMNLFFLIVKRLSFIDATDHGLAYLLAENTILTYFQINSPFKKINEHIVEQFMDYCERSMVAEQNPLK